jgi:serine/threonine-protein kinase HipA
MNGERVGVWRTPLHGSHEFVYAETWLSSAHARPISLSLPLRPSNEPFRQGVESFFDNLLPDNRAIRERIQRRFGAATVNPFDLLREIGRDCVGALQLLPEESAPDQIRRISGERLTRAGVAKLLNNSLSAQVDRHSRPGDDFRISLAGAQEKTALLWHQGAWHRPTGATPTTHIIKLPIGTGPQGIDLSTSVENEWLCGEILRAYGIPAAESRIETFGEFKVLVVERFDRKLSADETWWLRLPQEDFCQATATPPGRKYESDGGPGILQIMDLLRGSNRSEADRKDFLRTQVVFWLLAAIDGHAKNFSLFLLPRGGYELAPRYDVMSAHPVIGHGRGKLATRKVSMAMAVFGKNRHYRCSEIRRRHWVETANRCGLAEMDGMLAELVEQTPKILESLRHRIPGEFPASLADAILNGLESNARELQEQAGY